MTHSTQSNCRQNYLSDEGQLRAPQGTMQNQRDEQGHRDRKYEDPHETKFRE
jgi:hypothetical protein